MLCMNCQVRESLSPELLAEVYSAQPRVFCGRAITIAMKEYCRPEVVAIIRSRHAVKRSGKIAFSRVLMENFNFVDDS